MTLNYDRPPPPPLKLTIHGTGQNGQFRGSGQLISVQLWTAKLKGLYNRLKFGG